MRSIYLFLLIATFVFGASAQRLLHGGKPHRFNSGTAIKAYEVKFPNGVIVRKYDRKTEDEAQGSFVIGKGDKIFGEIPGAVIQAAAPEKFDAFWGDLDKNNSAELIIVDLVGESMGLGIDYSSVYIFPDFETTGWQEPLTFEVDEFGAEGTFVYDARARETLILITDFNGLENISNKPGTYFVGRFFRFREGLLKPATDKPIYARRYLKSFEKYRFATEDDPRRPWLWLNSPQTQKLKNDPEFSLNPLKSEIGTIERVETIIRKGGEPDDPAEYKLRQLIVKMNSGETKVIGLWGGSSNEDLEDERGKIFPSVFGVSPTNVSLPQGISPLEVWNNFAGRKIILNSYAPFSFEENNRMRYKLLFVE